MKCEPLHCPFCGKPPAVNERKTRLGMLWCVQCEGRDCRQARTFLHAYRWRVVRKWNRRRAPKPKATPKTIWWHKRPNGEYSGAYDFLIKQKGSRWELHRESAGKIYQTIGTFKRVHLAKVGAYELLNRRILARDRKERAALEQRIVARGQAQRARLEKSKRLYKKHFGEKR